MLDAADAIISIHPEHADAILAGTKTIELRRRIPDLAPGTRLWIYATRPTQAVVGMVTIDSIARAHPTTVWEQHGTRTGLDHRGFESYFNGFPVAFAVFLSGAQRVTPITIEELRGIRDGFRPPRVLVRLTVSEAHALRKLAARSFQTRRD